MKNTMPRLIDDRRRKRNVIITAGTLLVLAGIWFAHDAIARPGRIRAKELRVLSVKGLAELNRLDETLHSNGGLANEKAKLDQLAAGTLYQECGSFPAFDVDPMLYVVRDRPKAERIRTDFRKAAADWQSAKKELDGYRTAAAALSAEIAKKLSEPVLKDVETIQTDLRKTLEEIDSLLKDKPRPPEAETAILKERFARVCEAVRTGQSTSETQIGSRNAARDEANKLLEKSAEFAERKKNAWSRASKLGKEVEELTIDPTGPHLSIMKERLSAASETIRAEDERLGSALKVAETERDEKIKSARKTCSDALAKINAFNNLFGPLAPKDLVRDGLAAAEAFESAVAEDAEAWKTTLEEASSIRALSKRLREDATAICGQIDEIRKSGASAFDGARATELVGKLEASSKQLKTEVSKVSSAEPNPLVERKAARVQAVWTALETVKPDLSALVSDIRTKALNAKSKMNRTSTNRTILAECLANGSGPAKALLESRLSACAVPPKTESKLLGLESASASDGKGVADLQKKLEEVQTAVDGYAANIRQVEDALRKAEADGSFVRLKWEEGAQGRDPNNRFKDWTISSGAVLVPQGSASTRQYEWRFALDMPKAGEHQIEIWVEKPERNRVDESIPTDHPAKKEEVPDSELLRGRARGGHLCITGGLEVEGQVVAEGSKWITNLKPWRLVDGEQNRVVSARPFLREGFQSFRFTISLDSAPAGRSGGDWHIDRLRFHVYLDGQPVLKFWHKNQPL